MYESPIDVIFEDVKTMLEDGVMKVTQGMGIRVDKEELIKALNYDRDQYEKGRNDALWEIGRFCEWIPCEKRLPEKEGQYLVTLDFAWGKEIEMGEWFIFEDGHGEWVNPNSHVTVAWMPLPEPWKGEKE